MPTYDHLIRLSSRNCLAAMKNLVNCPPLLYLRKTVQHKLIRILSHVLINTTLLNTVLPFSASFCVQCVVMTRWKTSLIFSLIVTTRCKIITSAWLNWQNHSCARRNHYVLKNIYYSLKIKLIIVTTRCYKIVSA
jgi:hypothetical protein